MIETATRTTRRERAPHANDKPATGVKAVAKAARILRSFESSRSALTVREIADRTRLPRSTCHAICATLVAENLLELLPSGGYRLADSLVAMGGQVIERVGLVEAATPSMVSLSRTTRSEVHLGQVAHGWIVYLARMAPERGIKMRNWVGLRAPLHVTACGKAALSHLSPEQTWELVREALEDEDDVVRVMTELAAARRNGFSVADSFQPGVVSVGAPIVTRAGAVVGAISVAQPRGALTRSRIETLGGAVMRAAAETSQRMMLFRP